MVWRAGEPTDLNTRLDPDTEWVLHTAFALNDNGLVVGSGAFRQQARAFAVLLDRAPTATPPVTRAAAATATTAPQATATPAAPPPANMPATGALRGGTRVPRAVAALLALVAVAGYLLGRRTASPPA